ncbi:MAG TPA: hypothetical protein DIC35_01995 [Candidatus Moranbacteria bacterium]|nr:hypothetical protein [Candidatus Moranbacteria bacterium]
MFLKKLFKPTKIKIFSMLILFSILGVLKIFTLQNAITGEIYKNSLFDQYKFQYQHSNDSWYVKINRFYWIYFLFLHAISSYIIVCIISFISNRLRGRE